MTKNRDVSELMRENTELSIGEKLGIVYRLSLPGILAQIAEIIMQYIDAAMAGTLGAAASASIGLVASSTWLFGGMMRAASAGFAVQVAHATGAGNKIRTKEIFKQSLLTSFLFSSVLALIGVLISFRLPAWLGADVSIQHNAAMYFLIFCIFIPVRQLNWLGMQMLQCSGDMKTPSFFATLMCFLDVVFNFFLIFPSRMINLFGMEIPMYGAGLGVAGAQLGTSLAALVCMIGILYHAVFKSELLSLKNVKGKWIAESSVLKKAWQIGAPMAMEESALCMAQVVSTRIVAPLGTVAIAANSFAVTAESICYMPGYGIGSAATTLVGQSVGAERKDLARSFAWLTTFSGMAVMTVTGFLMYFICPWVFMLLTPSEEVRQLGVEVLRIELLAEPLFAASIVAAGALRGAGDTLMPGILNLVSIWGVRITLALILTGRMGLRGMWIAMASELCFRGIVFLIRLKRERWLAKLA